MIELHRYKTDKYADKIELRLEELVLAYKTVIHSDTDTNPGNSDHSLPYLIENEAMISGKEEIKTYLRELSNELKEQRSVSGDACYIDPQTGEIC